MQTQINKKILIKSIIKGLKYVDFDNFLHLKLHKWMEHHTPKPKMLLVPKQKKKHNT